MSLYYQDEHATLYHGDCIEVLATLPDASVDAVVTDPPYGLDFMSRAWDRYTPGDFQHWCEQWAAECLRVLKPGGHMVAFGGTRTFHRLTAGIEDAGFEVRDVLTWLYGSGFPKSMDVGKAIDKAADYRLQAAVRRAAVVAVEAAGLTLPGNSRHDWTVGEHAPGDKWWAKFQQWLPDLTDEDRERVEGDIVATIRKTAGWFTRGDIYAITAPATPEAAQWEGWGTALKPAWEPIVLARKPLAGTVAGNVLAHGTGALNIDACRVPATAEDLALMEARSHPNGTTAGAQGGSIHMQIDKPEGFKSNPAGRFPANVLIDDEAGAAIDAQTGTLKSGVLAEHHTRAAKVGGVLGDYGAQPGARGYGDEGGASRFFYSAKADSAERPVVDGVAHPTVKPLALMEWLIRLVTPPGGTVLEPFAGSGTTLEAAQYTGHRVIGVEKGAEYLPLIEHRIRRKDPRVKAPKPVEVHPDQLDMLAALGVPQ